MSFEDCHSSSCPDIMLEEFYWHLFWKSFLFRMTRFWKILTLFDLAKLFCSTCSFYIIWVSFITNFVTVVIIKMPARKLGSSRSPCHFLWRTLLFNMWKKIVSNAYHLELRVSSKLPFSLRSALDVWLTCIVIIKLQ